MLRLSAGALWVHRLRAGLAIGATAIGIAGVLVLTAVGSGARARVLDQLERLGRTMLVLTPAPVDEATRLVRGAGDARTLTSDDADALAHGSPAIVRTSAAVYGGAIARHGAVQNPTTVFGVTADWIAIRRFAITGGRFFTGREDSDRARVAVLGADARASLFADSVDPVGRTIRIGMVPFTVIGVLEARGISAGGTSTEDDRIYVPLGAAMHRLLGTDVLQVIYIEAASEAVMKDARADAAGILRVRHDLEPGAADDFVIDDQRAVLAAQITAQASFRRLLGGLALLSLTVAAVGILSTLLLSVRERRREIGLRVAVGARRTDLLVQFFAEALLLVVAGAVGGLGLGLAASRIVSMASTWDAKVDATTLGVTLLAALATGLCAGVLPAWRAAALDPVEALQAE